MHRSPAGLTCWFYLVILATVGSPKLTDASEPLSFDVRLLTVDANEGIAAGDVDMDGRLDLVAGRNWYRGGEWVPRPLRNIDDWNGYVESNGDYLLDVDGDGRLDVIAGSFLPTQVHWFRNPGEDALKLGKQWTRHLLMDTGASANEGQLLEDIDGDGTVEWIVNSWKANTATVVWRLVPGTASPTDDSTDQKKKSVQASFDAKRSVIGKDANGHGIAIGDISGDDRKDILVGSGWYEQPAEDIWEKEWRFHPDWNLYASLPMIVTDLDKDGDNDLIFGNGHDFGLQWWENMGIPDTDSGMLTWTEHVIDRSFSQPHSMIWKDLDGDGQPDLITGKRYYAHNGGDPGGKEVPCLYWYSWDQETRTFTRHLIDEGRVGTGLQIVVEDFNQDGHMDIAVAGKSGTYLLTAKQ
ncbi:FG-GAP repeat domain-containing protein [Rhodopirellula sallentina]|uniref:FG-GAP repeat protein n=1 Tax=Rhodopirellula sallentina SM41 TaxID=1263870 RepID=M5TSS8_9BACT|nr:VCBS repeat-containing protein [Rhodopirellula sallentina]EMI52119.1 FG-GAP repeat protein [Rhodopirellula sallentina SM41]